MADCQWENPTKAGSRRILSIRISLRDWKNSRLFNFLSSLVGQYPRMVHRIHSPRFLKWAGLALTVLVCAAWLVSLRRTFGICVEWNDSSISCVCQQGMFQIAALVDDYGFRPTIIWRDCTGSTYGGWRPPGIFLRDHSAAAWSPSWLLLLLVVVPTVLVWRADKRPSPGCCDHCDYNLTGNVSGTCPECGKTVTVGAELPKNSAAR